jgi:uncharacterized protein YndB with AHSA1/START domain
MPHNNFAIEINRPAKDVFPLLSGPNLTKWVHGLTKVEHEGAMRVGTKFRHVYQNRGVDYIELQGEVTSYQPDNCLGYTTKAEQNGAGFTTVATYKLTETESTGRTRVEYLSTSTYRGFFVRLMAPIVTIMGQRMLKKDMKKLKALAEQAK